MAVSMDDAACNILGPDADILGEMELIGRVARPGLRREPTGHPRGDHLNGRVFGPHRIGQTAPPVRVGRPVDLLGTGRADAGTGPFRTPGTGWETSSASAAQSGQVDMVAELSLNLRDADPS